ncbi:helix-turn-helix transcriptional regulator [Alisedimentitalea sp. MJ-SS2]|uniref:ArsR/SmtB family transcription factor n=1 Tax=Aliisedimentitalea sp. MJ-SS2 TaxID=3049795 RepID=UPI00291285D0|nr:helix-turn-helix transcriptional regulator [Alisedimentitalea sp. MJ-SS2]MDU8928181.1 helix-turn-helix transcriptional regulator [Alisedimentitalea sp. MJ-SS2]
MKDGPDISRIGAMLGDRTRSGMLVALLSGKALTAGELALETGVTPATASGHLKQLTETGLVSVASQGRHRYYTLAGEEVGHALETLIGLASTKGHLRTRTGPRDPALRQGRVCYDHLAGTAGVRVFDSLVTRGFLILDDAITLSEPGRAWATGFGIDLAPLDKARRPMCRTCLDWSERRTHLAGGLGAALLSRLFDNGWAQRLPDSRVVEFTRKGQLAFEATFPVRSVQ